MNPVAIKSDEMTEMYRSVSPQSQERNGQIQRPKSSLRPPSNVPYVVDNLWEWKRADGYPCRRRAVYASLTPESAKKSGPRDGQVYKVEIIKGGAIAQAKCKDSKEHPDVGELRKVILGYLGKQWIGESLAFKEPEGRLWIPCLRKEEVEAIICAGGLKKCREDIWQAIKYWDDVQLVPDRSPFPFEDGEVFFEAAEWRLVSSTWIAR